MQRQSLRITCIARIRTRSGKTLHLSTSATHALDILGGRSLFDRSATVFYDFSGHSLNVAQLEKMADEERRTSPRIGVRRALRRDNFRASRS